MKQLSQVMIIKVILDYYNSEEIEAAKELLFQHFPDQHRPKKATTENNQTRSPQR